jgi:hypothetical protein
LNFEFLTAEGEKKKEEGREKAVALNAGGVPRA